MEHKIDRKDYIKAEKHYDKFVLQVKDGKIRNSLPTFYSVTRIYGTNWHFGHVTLTQEGLEFVRMLNSPYAHVMFKVWLARRKLNEGRWNAYLVQEPQTQEASGNGTTDPSEV